MTFRGFEALEAFEGEKKRAWCFLEQTRTHSSGFTFNVILLRKRPSLWAGLASPASGPSP